MVCHGSICRMCPACPCCEYSVSMRIHQHIKDLMKNWMERLYELAPDTKLRDMKMMTSHDCGTYSISKVKVGSSLSRTQSVDVYEQLDLGIRQIDFRYGPVGKGNQNLAIRHGVHAGGNYFHELIKVKHWLEDNPYEFLIIDAKCEKQVSPEQRGYLIKFFQDKFSKFLIKKPDLEEWFDVSKVTLEMVRKRHPKRVLLLVDQMILDGSKDDMLEAEGFLNKDLYLLSKWHNTGSVQKLFTKIREDIAIIEISRHRFVNLQLILTPKTHMKAMASYCLCLNRTRIDQKHRQLFQNRQVQQFIRGLSGEPLNFVMMDFINYDPHILNFLVGLNFPLKLVVHQAWIVGSKSKIHDVTEKAQNLISASNSLWIINLYSDLGHSYRKCEFHVVYEYEEGKKCHKQIAMKRNDQYLLNAMSHMDVTLERKQSLASEKEMANEFNRRMTAVFRGSEDIFSRHSSPQANQTGGGFFRKSRRTETEIEFPLIKGEMSQDYGRAPELPLPFSKAAIQEELGEENDDTRQGITEK